MVYTEIKQRNGKKYYYRVKSVRKGNKVQKQRKYLGVNLNKQKLKEVEKKADKELVLQKKQEIDPELKKLIPKIRRILKKYKIKKAGIFGSYARGQQKKKSDIDVLIEPRKGMGLEFVGVKLELEDKLGKKVDLVTYKYIHPYIKKQVLDNEVRII